MTQTYDKTTLSFLHRLYAKEARTFGFRGHGRADFACWSRVARSALRELIGLNRIGHELAGFEPSVSLSKPEDLGDYTRQRGLLRAEPGFDLPFWYLKPSVAGPYPVGLFPHGHYADLGLDYAVGR